jgi:glycosyltransferase involved in cell wall biosynthesis
MERRLLAINPVDAPGGAETALMRLLAGLAGNGWQVAMTTPGAGRLQALGLAAGYECHELPLGGIEPGEGARALASWPRARKLAAGRDAVLLNGAVCGRLLPALVPPLGTRVAGSVLLHIHDMVGRVPGFWRWADAVLTDSEAAARALRDLRAHVVYCPVDADPPTATAPWPVGEGPVVGFVGRPEPRKGPLDLVRAAPLIRREIPEARVVVVGDEPYGLFPEYADQVATSEEVEHHAWNANAPGLMRHLDVLVLPSYREPFGTVLAEAMAVGTPVVASRVDGLPEVVEDGVSGRLVEPGDPAGLAAAVLEVIARREELGAAARLSARRFHTPEHVRRVERVLEAAA